MCVCGGGGGGLLAMSASMVAICTGVVTSLPRYLSVVGRSALRKALSFKGGLVSKNHLARQGRVDSQEEPLSATGESSS